MTDIKGHTCKMCGFTGLRYKHVSMVDCVQQYRLLVDELRGLLPQGECVWTPDNDGVYWTSCDNAHQFTDGGPTENKHKYCPYCSKPLVEHPATKESQ